MRVGIDLGTTNTVVSYIDDNGMWVPLEFKRNGSDENPYFLPSCVAVADGFKVVGRAAVNYGRKYPDRLLKDTKYSIGEYEKSYSVGGMTLTPLDVAQYILTEVRSELASQFPSENSFNAFVTVPARFKEPARHATRTALKNAGFELNESCLTDEPISAAIAYSSHLAKDKIVLVVDIGGGTFDLALIKTAIVGAVTNPNNIEPLSWGGELHLGGNDVDEVLVRDITEQIMKETGKYLYVSAGAILGTQEETHAADIIRTLPFQIKQQLYNEGTTEAHVFVPELLRGYNLSYTVTREKYRQLIFSISEKMSNHIDNIFVTAPCSMGDVDHVLVVGGMAHEICLQEILEAKFGKDKIIIPQDAMMLVSRGAAICNSNMNIHVENRAYSSIGLLEAEGKSVSVIIKEGDAVKHGKVFEASAEASDANATSVRIRLVEYRGNFSPDNYNIIFEDEVILNNNNTRTFGFNLKNIVKSVLKHEVLPKIDINIEFTEDKILVINVTQSDGTVTTLDHRL
ncbi:MAG: Hsp70 family protein [Ruminococcus flavefaciens]|nr:Hsp70 family protein [Ruminococcus flavefaciens]